MKANVNSLYQKLAQNPFGSDNGWSVHYVNNVISGEAFWREVAAGKPPECAGIIARYGRFVQPHLTGCWLWTGSRTGSWKGGQHGQFALYHGTHIYAHRLSYLLFNGPLKPGQLVCHRCDVCHCVRPSHLFAGSQKDNLQDASVKGRLPKFRAFRKMSPDDVREALALRQQGWLIQALADRYDVSKALISNICLGKARVHLDDSAERRQAS